MTQAASGMYILKVGGQNTTSYKVGRILVN